MDEIEKQLKRQNKLLEEILKSGSIEQYLEGVKAEPYSEFQPNSNPYDYKALCAEMKKHIVEGLEETAKREKDMRWWREYFPRTYEYAKKVIAGNRKDGREVNPDILKFVEDYEKERNLQKEYLQEDIS